MKGFLNRIKAPNATQPNITKIRKYITIKSNTYTKRKSYSKSANLKIFLIVTFY